VGRDLYGKIEPPSLTQNTFADVICFHQLQYTEFSTYVALLSGDPPISLQNCLMVQHRQTWKLREHHLLVSQVDSSSITDPLSPGGALRSYFPVGTIFREDVNGVDVHEPGNSRTIRYERAGSKVGMTGDQTLTILDIIITGEVRSVYVLPHRLCGFTAGHCCVSYRYCIGSLSMGPISSYGSCETLRRFR
jgi:hypothetical protein